MNLGASLTVPDNAYQLTYDFGLERIATTEDLAEFGIWLSVPDPDLFNDAELLSLATGGYHAWANNMVATRWTNAAYLRAVYATTYTADGHTSMEQSYAPDSPWIGTATGPSLPWETSLAVSLYTYPRGSFVVNGRRKRGRIYMPPMAAGELDPSNSGYFNNSNLATFLGEAVAFINDCGGDATGFGTGTPCVYSRVDSVLRTITQVSVDARFDSQRRRENREVAGYLTSDL